jgi:hypothetical protein
MAATGQGRALTKGGFRACRQRQWRRPSAGAISRWMARHTRSRPAHIHNSPSRNTRHCLTSRGLGSKCKDQVMPPQVKLQSNGCRRSSGATNGAPSSRPPGRRRSTRASRSELLVGR